MSKEKICIGIIGAGQIAQHHLELYSKMDDVEIVAISDLIEEKGKKAQHDYGIKNFYKDPREMLLREDIVAVDVCVHNNKHMPLTVAALEAGKHVYCEKPMAGSYTDAVNMLETAKRLNKKLAVQIVQLYTSETRAAKKLIDSDELGTLYHARSTGFRRRGRPYVDGYGKPAFVRKDISAGGALYDMGVYHISQILYLLNNPKLERISGKVYQNIDMNEQRKKLSGFDVEELGLGFVRFENNLTLDIIESWAINLDKIEGSSIVGSKGGIKLSPFTFCSKIAGIDFNSTVDLGQAQFIWSNVENENDYYSDPQRHWICALQGKVDLVPSAEIALNTMLVSEGIYLSSKLGREVTYDEIIANSKSSAFAGEDIYKSDDLLREESLNR